MSKNILAFNSTEEPGFVEVVAANEGSWAAKIARGNNPEPSPVAPAPAPAPAAAPLAAPVVEQPAPVSSGGFFSRFTSFFSAAAPAPAPAPAPVATVAAAAAAAEPAVPAELPASSSAGSDASPLEVIAPPPASTGKWNPPLTHTSTRPRKPTTRNAGDDEDEEGFPPGATAEDIAALREQRSLALARGDNRQKAYGYVRPYNETRARMY